MNNMKLHYRVAIAAAKQFDQFFGTSMKERVGRFYRYFLKKLSPIRRMTDPLLIELQYYLAIKRPKNLKLHLGCGWKHFTGYINVDLWITDATDIICDIASLPWPDNSVDVIESYHVIEHISHTEIKKTLKEWHRALSSNGKLILECPNFDSTVQEYLGSNEERLLNIFGRQRFDGDSHLYGYSPQRLTKLLTEIGFTNICVKVPQSSQSLDEPSFRVECQKTL